MECDQRERKLIYLTRFALICFTSVLYSICVVYNYPFPLAEIVELYMHVICKYTNDPFN